MGGCYASRALAEMCAFGDALPPLREGLAVPKVGANIRELHAARTPPPWLAGVDVRGRCRARWHVSLFQRCRQGDARQRDGATLLGSGASRSGVWSPVLTPFSLSLPPGQRRRRVHVGDDSCVSRGPSSTETASPAAAAACGARLGVTRQWPGDVRGAYLDAFYPRSCSVLSRGGVLVTRRVGHGRGPRPRP